jgi:hypothetical protein
MIELYLRKTVVQLQSRSAQPSTCCSVLDEYLFPADDELQHRGGCSFELQDWMSRIKYNLQTATMGLSDRRMLIQRTSST